MPQTAPEAGLLTTADRRDLFQDDFNEAAFARPGLHLTRSLVFADNKGVDGAVGGVAALVGGSASRLAKLQNGYVRSYATTMLIGVVAILGLVWVIN